MDAQAQYASQKLKNITKQSCAFPSSCNKAKRGTGFWKPQQISSSFFSLRVMLSILLQSSKRDAGEEEEGDEPATSCHDAPCTFFTHCTQILMQPTLNFNSFKPQICASPSREVLTVMSPCPPHFCSELLHFFLQAQHELGGGQCNSIGLQICLGSILILFKGQSIEPSLGFSETEFHLVFNMHWMHRPGKKYFSVDET